MPVAVASQSQSLPTFYACRWAWCIHHCQSQADLNRHVISDHINKAKPIRRGDLPVIEKAEGGESFNGSREQLKTPRNINDQKGVLYTSLTHPGISLIMQKNQPHQMPSHPHCRPLPVQTLLRRNSLLNHWPLHPAQSAGSILHMRQV